MTIQYRMLIDGESVDASDGTTFTSLNPATEEPWAEIPAASEDDVDRAVNAAQRAFAHGPWARALPAERGKLLFRLADLLDEHAERLGRVETVDTGKLFKETRWQARYVADFFRFFGGAADKIHGDTLPIDKPDTLTLTVREPLGVVAAVVPWNSQLFLAAVKLGPALATGNTVVLKVSEHASAPLLDFAELVTAAGFPAGVVNVISGHGEPCGRALTSHPLVARISFTGGPAAARQVVHNSAQNLAQTSLELGGKSPFIVFDDADLESAVNGAVAAIFGASGQSCVAGARLYLHEAIADDFLARLCAIAEAIRIGDPLADDTEMGPLATSDQCARIEAALATARAQGAEIVSGGGRPPDLARGWYVEPTIVACPRQDLDIVDTELFGPVLCVLRFRDEDEVVAHANDSRYGLAAGVFTRDGARALRVTRALRAGIVWVNTYRMVSPVAEFGGFKLSGWGRESGLQALYDYTRSKTVWLNTGQAPLANPFVMR